MNQIKRLKLVSKKSWLIVCILCFGLIFTTTYAYTSTVSATVDNMLKMRLNGEAFRPLEEDGTAIEPLLINNRTYLPVRAVLEKVGVFVDFEPDSNTVVMRDDNALLNRANLALYSLKYKDGMQLSKFVHPSKGLRFTPYATLDDTNLSFSVQEVAALFVDNIVRTWGVTDGKGDDIKATFTEYYEQFVFDADFADADEIGRNAIIGSGNSLINIEDIYPQASFIEYFIKGSEEYDGMDWKGLRLIMEWFDGEWFLVAVAHDQWTV